MFIKLDHETLIENSNFAQKINSINSLNPKKIQAVYEIESFAREMKLCDLSLDEIFFYYDLLENNYSLIKTHLFFNNIGNPLIQSNLDVKIGKFKFEKIKLFDKLNYLQLEDLKEVYENAFEFRKIFLNNLGKSLKNIYLSDKFYFEMDELEDKISYLNEILKLDTISKKDLEKSLNRESYLSYIEENGLEIALFSREFQKTQLGFHFDSQKAIEKSLEIKFEILQEMPKINTNRNLLLLPSYKLNNSNK